MKDFCPVSDSIARHCSDDSILCLACEGELTQDGYGNGATFLTCDVCGAEHYIDENGLDIIGE